MVSRINSGVTHSGVPGGNASLRDLRGAFGALLFLEVFMLPLLERWIQKAGEAFACVASPACDVDDDALPLSIHNPKIQRATSITTVTTMCAKGCRSLLAIFHLLSVA